MAATKKAFVLGPGYVGREIIDRLLADKYAVTTIVRRDNAAQELERAGVTAVMGDLNNNAKITNLAAESDVVFHTATADHLASAEAILAGVKERAAKGKSTIYLHQSGASVLSDGSHSEYLNDKVYSDKQPDELDALPDNAPHRQIDLALLATRKELKEQAKIFIMMPPIIYGNNPKYGRLSIQVPTLSRFAIKHSYAGFVGEGRSAWGVVHVLDLVEAYMQILHWLEKSPPEVALEQPYFFCESEEKTWYEVSRVIGTGLYRAGKISDATPKSIPKSEYGDLFGEFTPDVIGCNCRHKAERVRSLGWKPSQPGLEEAFRTQDLPILLEEKEFKSSSLSLS